MNSLIAKCSHKLVNALWICKVFIPLLCLAACVVDELRRLLNVSRRLQRFGEPAHLSSSLA